MNQPTKIGMRSEFENYEIVSSIKRHPASQGRRPPAVVAAIAKGGVKHERVALITEPNGLEPFARWQKKIKKPQPGWGEGVKVSQLISVRQINNREAEQIAKQESIRSLTASMEMGREINRQN